MKVLAPKKNKNMQRLTCWTLHGMNRAEVAYTSAGPRTGSAVAVQSLLFSEGLEPGESVHRTEKALWTLASVE